MHLSHLVVHNTACELFGPICEPLALNVNLLVVDESYFGRACESLFVGLLETLHCTVYNLKNYIHFPIQMSNAKCNLSK